MKADAVDTVVSIAVSEFVVGVLDVVLFTFVLIALVDVVVGGAGFIIVAPVETVGPVEYDDVVELLEFPDGINDVSVVCVEACL